MSSRFRYRASTPRGELVEGVLEARSRSELLDQLRNRELHAITVDELGSPPRRMRGPGGRSVSVSRWCRSFATLVGAGTPVERALRVSVDQADDPALADVLENVRREVQEGEDLSAALARHPRWFPSVVPAMARAGEATGALGEAFGHVADYLEDDADLRGQVRSALVYPTLMAAVAGVGVSILLLFVVPRFAVILDDIGGSLPLSTRVLVFSGAFLSHWWWLVLALLAALGLLARGWLREPANRKIWHRRRLSWPVLGELERKFVTARFTRIVGLLLTNGLSLLPALRIGRASVQNLHFGDELEGSMAGVAQGGPLASSVEHLFPGLAVELLAVGEESGQLGPMCLRVASAYDRELRRSMSLAVSLLEPTMIIVFGGLVGLVALAMLQAIYSVNATLG